MDDYWSGSPRDVAARNVGQEAARSFFDNPIDGETVESFVVGEVTGEIVRLTGIAQKARQGEIKAWRRRQFIAPIALAVTGITLSIATTPRADSNGSSAASLVGVFGLTAGVLWLIVNAFRASQKLSEAQRAREVETGRLLTIAREAAAATYTELERSSGSRTEAIAAEADVVGADEAVQAVEASPIEASPIEMLPAEAVQPQRTVEESPAPTNEKAVADNEAASERVPEQRHIPSSPPPHGQPFGVTQEGAAYLVAAWMRHLGDTDAGTTDYSAGGSFDAASTRSVAKAKNDTESVSVDEVRALVDAAAGAGRRALFFASGPYADDAQTLAEEANVVLFTYDAVVGTLDGANELGRTAVLEGLK